jgi:hypothetical protein
MSQATQLPGHIDVKTFSQWHQGRYQSTEYLIYMSRRHTAVLLQWKLARGWQRFSVRKLGSSIHMRLFGYVELYNNSKITVTAQHTERPAAQIAVDERVTLSADRQTCMATLGRSTFKLNR